MVVNARFSLDGLSAFSIIDDWIVKMFSVHFHWVHPFGCLSALQSANFKTFYYICRQVTFFCLARISKAYTQYTHHSALKLLRHLNTTHVKRISFGWEIFVYFYGNNIKSPQRNLCDSTHTSQLCLIHSFTHSYEHTYTHDRQKNRWNGRFNQ